MSLTEDVFEGLPADDWTDAERGLYLARQEGYAAAGLEAPRRRTPRLEQRLWFYNLDADGRMFLPEEVVRLLGRRLALALGRSATGAALVILSAEAWERREAAQGSCLTWWQFDGSLAVTCTVDAARRIQVPLHLRDLLGLCGGEEQVVRLAGQAAEVLPRREWLAQMRVAAGARDGA